MLSERMLARLFLTCLFACGLIRAQPSADQRGLFVYTEHLAQDQQQVLQALNVPGIDGLTLLQDWASLETGLGTYDWTNLDQWISTAASSGKKLTLAIRAGASTPCWLFQAPQCGAGYNTPYAGATALTFQVSARQGVGQAGCNPAILAVPWDPIFLSAWDTMLAAVAAHLKSAGTYNVVTSVRLTGINRTTAELRLPEEILSSPCVTNSIQTWLAAPQPYRPALVLRAWDAVTNSFQKSFPDKAFGLEVVPDDTGNASYPFPEIDDNGCVYSVIVPATSVPGACLNSGPLPDQIAALVQLAAQKFPGQLAISFQNLDLSTSANPYPIQAAQTYNTAIGYQTNDYNNLQTAACSGGSLNPGPCTAATYLQLLEVGIFPLGSANSLRAQYIEVLPPDATAFPSAIAQAHKELLTPALASGTAANGATYIAGGLVPGSWAQVKGGSLAGATHLLGSSDLSGNNLPTSLSGASVMVNGQAAALYYISPTQIDFQVPAGVSGTASVQAFNNGNASNVVTGAAASSAPGIWPITENGVNYAAAVFLDGKFAGDPNINSQFFRKAKPGDQVQLFGTGLGPSPPGILINGFQPVSGVTVTLGNITVPAEGAGLVAPGEFQINFAVPQQFANLAEGNYPLTVTVNGVSSPAMINSVPPGPLVIPIQH